MQRRLLLAILGAAATCAVAAGMVLMHQSAPVAESPAGPHTPEYRVCIDPATGALTSQPTGAGAAPVGKDTERSLSTSSEGLREVPSPVPGGGTMVDLQGRFRNVSVATVDENGDLEAPCVSGLPADTSGDGEAGDE
jgi:hypothetical protein